jgi:hypothetical protein
VGKRNASRPDPAETAGLAARRKLLAALDGLPEVTEGTSYGYPTFKVGKKFLCRIKDAGTLVVTCPLEEKEMLMAAAPAIYFETDHYRGWPAVLVRIEEIDTDELRHRLLRAWMVQAPKKLVKQFQSAGGR